MERHEIKHIKKRLCEAADALRDADYILGELDEENDQLKNRIQILETASSEPEES